jgi:hypothetical protein
MTEDLENSEGVSETTIANALEAIRARISHLDRQRAELERALGAAREEERLLLRLLALRRGIAPEANAQAMPGEGPDNFSAKESTRIERAEEADHPAVQAVLRELAGAGRPLHLSELMRLLRERQVQIPGAGTQANLITHLRRDPRLVRPSRGMYGLSAWGLENMPTTTRQKRRRKRVRSKAATKRTEA